MKVLPIVLCIGLIPIAAFQASKPERTTSASVQGKVLQGPDGPPVRKANVQLNGWIGRQPAQYSAITDAQGQFTISEVEAGKYIAAVEHPGFVQSAAGRKRASITVQPGSPNELMLYMEPAAILSGKIVDLDGDAMRDVSVSAIRDGSRGAGQGVHSFGNAGTNDLGEFRISGLRAGRYKVTATPPRGARPSESKENGAVNRTIYLPTLYPGVLNEEQATVVEVRAGTETRINFGLMTGRAYGVSGAVTGLSSKSSMSQIMLEPQVSGGSQSEPQELGDGGKFEFKNVLPGSYSARLVLITFEGGKPGMQMVSFGQTIEVSNSDLHGLVLQPEPGGHVTGKFRLDVEEKFDWTQLTAVLMPTDGGGMAVGTISEFGGRTSSTKLNADGSFELEDVPGGKYQLLVAGDPNKLADYFTRSVSVNGRDVSDDPGFSVKETMYLDVVVSAKGASITGKVVDDKGQPIADATVIDVPSAEHRARLDVYQRTTSDATGNFSLRGLIAGKYSVLAFEELQEDVRGSEFLKLNGGRGELVQLEEGSKKTVLLKVITDQDTAP